MDISEFKAQNPDYKDVPDVVLADALHAKFYSEVPREQFLQQVGVAGPGGNFGTSMPRADYAKQFMANNPQAGQDALDMALAQFDKSSGERTQAAGNAVQDKFAQMNSPEATFNARLNERLRGPKNGVVPQLPGRVEPDTLQPINPTPSTYDTVAGNLVGGTLDTLTGAIASGAHLVGADEVGNEFDKGKEQIQARQKELGGDTFAGKVSSVVGGIAPALAVPADLVSQLVANAGLFAKPAFDDTLKAKLAQGYSRPLALAHAAEAFGINLFLPTVAARGSGAVIKGLGQAEAAGLRGAAVGLGQAAGEGVGFSAINSVADKGTDVLAGQKNDRPWLDPEDMAVQAASFGALRAGHMVAHAAGSLVDATQQARSHAALIADIGKASTVDEAIAAANVAVNASSPSDTVADMLKAIRPLGQEVKAPVAEPDGRIEPTLGEPAAPARPALEGVDLTAGTPDPDAPQVWRARDATPTPQRDALDRIIDPNGDWHAFPAETGTLGVPRETMPQIRAEHRGALTNFLNARGITHEQVEVPAESLKPTQAEFSLDKVLKAKEFEGGNRSILISADGYVLDGHHQWLAAVDAGEPVKAIRLDAPIADLLETVKEFPSATVADGAPAAEQPAPVAAPNHLEAAQQKFNRQDDLVRKAQLSLEQRKLTGGARARERLQADNPFLAFLANHGVSMEDRADTGAEKGRAGNPLVPGYGPVFRRTGLRLDELALAAEQAGFLTQADIDHANDTGGTRKLAEMVQRAVQGREVIRPVAEVDHGVPGAHDQLLAEAQRLGIDARDMSPDQVYDAVVSQHDALEQHRGITGAATVHEQDQIAHHADQFDARDLAAIAELDADIRLEGGKSFDNLTDEQIDEIFGIKSAAEPAQAGGRQDQSRAAASAPQGDGRTAEPDPVLDRYSPAQVAARQAEATRSATSRAQEQARLETAARAKTDAADVKARQDASAEHFTLGQDAHDALAGQRDIFQNNHPEGEAGMPARAGAVESPPSPESVSQKHDTVLPSGKDSVDDIPHAFQKKVKVPVEVWIEDEGKFETVDMPAHKALKSAREDIDSLTSLLNCLKG